MRDLLPADKVSSFFARRMMYSTLLGAVLSLIVAHYLATAQAIWPQQTIVIFSMIAMIGGLVGLVGVGLVWPTPEPKNGQTRPHAIDESSDGRAVPVAELPSHDGFSGHMGHLRQPRDPVLHCLHAGNSAPGAIDCDDARHLQPGSPTLSLFEVGGSLPIGSATKPCCGSRARCL